MYILVDIGGTKTRVAASHDLNLFSEPDIFPTPLAYEEGMRAISESVTRIAGGEKVERMAVGIRGVLARDQSKLLNEWKLTDWILKPLRTDLARAHEVFGLGSGDHDFCFEGATRRQGPAVGGAGKRGPQPPHPDCRAEHVL